MPSLAKLLAPNEREYFVLFERAGENLLRAAELLERLIVSYPDERELAGSIRECEEAGDRIVHELISRLNQTFVTPIDREDILQLASALDDIVDFTDEAADYLGVYKVEAPTLQAQALATILVEGTRQLVEAIRRLRGFQDISVHMVEVHRLENEGNRIVRDAVGALFEAGTDPMVVIRWKDIYERLEAAIHSTERAAWLIEGVVIKNS
jgi:uncharacterized protein